MYFTFSLFYSSCWHFLCYDYLFIYLFICCVFPLLSSVLATENKRRKKLNNKQQQKKIDIEMKSTITHSFTHLKNNRETQKMILNILLNRDIILVARGGNGKCIKSPPKCQLIKLNVQFVNNLGIFAFQHLVV